MFVVKKDKLTVMGDIKSDFEAEKRRKIKQNHLTVLTVLELSKLFHQ